MPRRAGIDDWAVVIPSMGGDFHRIDSLDSLYNKDTIIAYGLDKDKSWILYTILQEMGMESVLAMPLMQIQAIVAEVKDLSWLEAYKIVEQLKAEGHR